MCVPLVGAVVVVVAIWCSTKACDMFILEMHEIKGQCNGQISSLWTRRHCMGDQCSPNSELQTAVLLQIVGAAFPFMNFSL